MNSQREEGDVTTQRENLIQESQKAPILEEVVKTKQTYHKYYRNANFFSKILFFYCLPMINAVNKNNGNMTEEMIIDMNIRDDETDKNTACFKKLMKQKLEAWQKKNPNKDPRTAPWYKMVRNSIFGTFYPDFLLATFCATMGEGITVTYTYFLAYLINYLQDPTKTAQYGVVVIVIFSLAVIIATFFRNYYYFLGYRIAIQMRKTIVSSMYDKVGVLSMKSLTETNSGKLITIISSDVFNVERAVTLLPLIPASPIVLILCLFYISWSTGIEFAGYTLIIWICTLGAQAICNEVNKRTKGGEAVLNDQRMKLVNDLVTGIRTIKSYAWENHYLKKIREIRLKQHSRILKYNLIGSLGYTLFQNMGLVAVLIIFVPKWARGELISSAWAFSLLAMIFYLFFSITALVLFGMSTLVQLFVLFRRLGEVFQMEEKQEQILQKFEPGQTGLDIENGSFSWGFRVLEDQSVTKAFQVQVEQSETPTIQNITFQLKHDSLLMVCGKIGSGKTTLLYSIMEETRKISGKMQSRGKFAYVEQEPFIYSSTIEENITFGLTYDQKRFDHAIESSCLSSDMKLFANGQKTIIGERGINVSGGQKARISLARAIYQDADIYLLDDPLSAVDPEVANQIFEKAILGSLQSKCVILVTHQLQFMKKCPQILILKDGKQDMIGTCDELLKQGFDADEILQNYTQSLDKKQSKNKIEETLLQKTDRNDQRVLALQKLKSITEKHLRSQELNEKNKSQLITPVDVNQVQKEDAADLITPEQILPGKVSFQDYRDLVSFGPGAFGLILLLLTSILTALAQLATSFSLSNWTSQNLHEQQKSYYPGIFGGAVLLFIVCCIARAFLVFWITINSTTNLHNEVCSRVLRANILFFDSNPIGRIVTRFSKDVSCLDFTVPAIVIFIIQGMFRALSVGITVGVINPYLFIVIFFGVILMALILRKGTRAMQDSQKMDGILRGPIHSTFAMMISGLVTLRAFDKIKFFKQDFDNTLEKCANATFCYTVANRWVGVNLDLICVVFTIATAAIAFAQRGHVNTNMLVLSLQIITDVIASFSVSLRLYAELGNFMTSSQRLVQYTKLPLEDELNKKIDEDLMKLNWPERGEIEFETATMKYREGLEPSIKNLNFKAQAGMKIGIVGRTGSGKSSILQTLFRLVELNEGCSKIDGVDLKEIGLHQLRKNIAFIPQTPFLLQGTIRENLDPFEEITDEQIKEIVKDLKLDKKVDSLKEGLLTYCAESNNLFSVGQKQLVCLARAIIRKTKLLVLDEATANVDLETDNLIQSKLRESFKDCTVLIIAHRLATIIDADRILVMSAGKAAEYDHPYRLLVEKIGDDTITNQSGFFAQMVLANGLETAQTLFEIAKQQYEQSSKKFKPELTEKIVQQQKQQEATAQARKGVFYYNQTNKICQIRGQNMQDIVQNNYSVPQLIYFMFYSVLPSEVQLKQFQDNLELNLLSQTQCDLVQIPTTFGQILEWLAINHQEKTSKNFADHVIQAISQTEQLLPKLFSSLGFDYWQSKDRQTLINVFFCMLDFDGRKEAFRVQNLALQGKNVFETLKTVSTIWNSTNDNNLIESILKLLEEANGSYDNIDISNQFKKYACFVTTIEDPKLSSLQTLVNKVASNGNTQSIKQFEHLILRILADQESINASMAAANTKAYIVFILKELGCGSEQIKYLNYLAKVYSWIVIYNDILLEKGNQ